MKRQRLLAFFALAACIGTIHAQSQGGRITFAGQVVQGTCNIVSYDGDGCDATARSPLAYREHTAPAPNATDAALLDYFIDGADGARLVATREYR